MLVIKYKAIKKFEVAEASPTVSPPHTAAANPVAAEITASVRMNGVFSPLYALLCFQCCFLDVVDTKLVIYALY